MFLPQRFIFQNAADPSPDRAVEAESVAPPAVPEPPPQAPPDQRAEVHAASRAGQLEVVEQEPFTKQFLAFIKGIEQSGKHDFFGGDSGIEELRANEVWKELQDALREKLQGGMAMIPKSIDSKVVDIWLAEACKQMAERIASFNNSSGEMMSKDISPSMEACFGDKGNPGPFIKWFEKRPEYAAWKKRIDDAQKAVGVEKAAALIKLAEARKQVEGPDFPGLQALGREIEAHITGAVSADELQSASDAIGVMSQVATEAATARGTINHAGELAGRLSIIGPLALQGRVNDARGKLSAARTLAGVEVARQLVASTLTDSATGQNGATNWETLDRLLGKIDAAERVKLKPEFDKPDFDPQTMIARLGPAESERSAVLLQSSMENPGWVDKFFVWLSTPFFGRQIPEGTRATICGAVLAVLGLVGGFRRDWVHADTLLQMAKLSGKQEWIETAEREATAEKLLLGAGLTRETANAVMDLPADQFLQTPEQSMAKKPEDIMPLHRIKVSLNNNKVPDTTTASLATVLASTPNFAMEQTPGGGAVGQAPTETLAPPSLDKVLTDKLSLTPDELAKAKTVSASGVAKGTVAKPADFDSGRWAALVQFLKENQAHEITDSNRSVASYLEPKIQDKSLKI